MKYEIDQEVTLGNSKNEAKSFKIASSAKAFKILSSSLYKNKILAIVRELSCNALDAHKLVGQTKPFEITPPTVLEPRFKIRDFGPGLSQEDMEELYTTYFASTKNNSNDFIGALGLGSKSPFSYSNVFTAISYQSGIAKVYSLFLENGEPNIRLINTTDTEEADGISISVPVQSNDISKWSREIYVALTPFKPEQFKILSDNFDISHTEIPEKGWKTEFTGGKRVLYGNIIYPIDMDILDISGSVTVWLPSSMIIRMELGQLDIAPSREELSYDESTINILTKTLVDISDSIKNEHTDKISSIGKREQLRYISNHTMSNVIRENMMFSGNSYHDNYRNQIYPNISYNIPEEELMVYDMYTAIKQTFSHKNTKRNVPYDIVPSYRNKAIIVVEKTCKRSHPAIVRSICEEYSTKDEICDYLIISNPEHTVQLLENMKRIMQEDEVIFLKSSDIKIQRKEVVKLKERRTNVKVYDGTKLVDVKMSRNEIADQNLPYLQTHGLFAVYKDSYIEKYNSILNRIYKQVGSNFILLTTQLCKYVNTDNVYDICIRNVNSKIDELENRVYTYNTNCQYMTRYKAWYKFTNTLMNDELESVRDMLIDRPIEDHSDVVKYLDTVEMLLAMVCSNTRARIDTLRKKMNLDEDNFRDYIETIMTQNPLISYAIASIENLGTTDLLLEQIKQFGEIK